MLDEPRCHKCVSSPSNTDQADPTYLALVSQTLKCKVSSKCTCQNVPAEHLEIRLLRGIAITILGINKRYRQGCAVRSGVELSLALASIHAGTCSFSRVNRVCWIIAVVPKKPNFWVCVRWYTRPLPTSLSRQVRATQRWLVFASRIRLASLDYSTLFAAPA